MRDQRGRAAAESAGSAPPLGAAPAVGKARAGRPLVGKAAAASCLAAFAALGGLAANRVQAARPVPAARTPMGSSSPQRASRHRSSRVREIVPASSGLIAAAQPQPDGFMWVLSGRPGVRTIDELNLLRRRQVRVVGESADTSALAQSPTGVLALGLAAGTAGAVELANGTTGARFATIEVGAPVRALAFAPDGVTLYVLNGGRSSASVSVVDTRTRRVLRNVGVQLDADAVAPASGGAVYTVGRSGSLLETVLATRRVVQKVTVGTTPLAITAAPDGRLLYVLRSVPSGADVSVVEAATEQVREVLPAARGSVDVTLSPDGGTLWDVVGTPTLGNAQAIQLSGRGL